MFHAGIDLKNGNVALYNSETKKVSEENYFALNIELIFQKIVLKVGKNLGCVCIVTDEINNELRKKVYTDALIYGFCKAEIISSRTANFLNLIADSNYKPENDDVIWVLDGSYRRARNDRHFLSFGGDSIDCDVWHLIDNEIKHVKRLLFYEDNFLSLDNIDEIRTASKLFSKPNVIYHQNKVNNKTFDIEYFQKEYPECKIVKYEKQGNEKGALAKTRLMAETSWLSNWNVENSLHNYIFIFHGEDKIMAFIELDTLPVSKAVFLNKQKNVDEIIIKMGTYDSVVIEHFKLPSFEKMIFVFNIDKNGIYSMKCINCNHNFDQIFIKKTTEIELAFLNCNINKCDTQTSYKFPSKLLSNDQEVNTVGIDLGTTRCCAAVYRMNKMETVALENTGGRLLPSYVAYDETNVKCGKIVITRLRDHAKSSVFDSKRIIGKSVDEIVIDENWPFKLLSLEKAESENVETIHGIFQILKHGSSLIEIDTPEGKTIMYPEEVSAALLKHVKKITEDFEGKKISNAVITVPAAFTNAQKNSTFVAASLAGFSTIYLLPESIASAFAYFIDRPIPANSDLLLFDLGGGTLDICIFRIENDDLKIVAQSGDTYLGGRDFDNILINHFKNELHNTFNISLTSSMKHKLMQKCQSIKENLSILEDDM